jgi:hypothetical protein
MKYIYVIVFIMEIDCVLCKVRRDCVLCKVRTNAENNLDDVKMKIKTVLCEVSNGAEGRFRIKNNILDRLCSL